MKENQPRQTDQQATNAALAALAAAGNSFGKSTRVFCTGCSGNGTAKTRPLQTMQV